MKRLLSILRLALVVLVGIGAMVALMLWLSGAFHDKIQPGQARATEPAGQIPPTVTVQSIEVTAVRQAVGRIAAAHETRLASRLPAPAKVVEVRVRAGDGVNAGEVLIRLDDKEYQARVDQAKAALDQAKDDFARIKRLEADNKATPREVMQYTTALASAQAKFDEVKAVLDYTEIRAPDPTPLSLLPLPSTQPEVKAVSDWMVIDKFVEVGQVVQPGQVVATLFDRLQLTATVPESLQQHLSVGQAVKVRIPAVNMDCEGVVSEIVPQADPVSRSFEVKVTGPCQGGILNMFGRMNIPTGTRQEIRIPAPAVRRVGQITTVFKVLDGGQGEPRLMRQFVVLGDRHGEQVVVSSGLSAGDRIVADASAVSFKEAD